MIQLNDKQIEARNRSCLALDVPTVNGAIILAETLAPYIGKFKIGKQLHTAAGMEAVNIVNQIYHQNISSEPNIFLDLKLHDTPNTVYEAAKAGTVSGVYMMDVHIAGGEEMCKKALEGVREAASYQNIPIPRVIGVTVLTSLDDDDLEVVCGADKELLQRGSITYDSLVKRRAEAGKKWGLDGIVCPASKASSMEKLFGSDWLYVTPGVVYGQDSGFGQKQLYTVDRAVQDCSSSILVLGSAITKAVDKYQRACDINALMAQYL
jgi:orotidine-5'-phosphate decarboxylase